MYIYLSTTGRCLGLNKSNTQKFPYVSSKIGLIWLLVAAIV